MTEETSQQLPSMKPSDEADAPQLRLAKKQGDASIISCSRSASAMALLGCAKGSISAYTTLVHLLKLDV
jgi:hypothetical protein